MRYNNLFYQLKKDCLIVDIETCAMFANGDDINISYQFEQYLEAAQVKWFGAYSYARNMLYTLEVSKNINFIKQLLNSHNTIIGFNSEEFDYVILKNQGFITDERKRPIHIDCMQILGKSTFHNKKGYPFKNRGELMKYKFKKNSLKAMAEGMNLDYHKGEIDYNIFKKNSWTQEESEEIKTYLKSDILITKQMFEKLWDFWSPFTEMLNEKFVKDFSWIRSSIASLTYKAACSYLDIEPSYSDKITKQEKMGGNVLLPAYEEARNVWYVDFASLYPHLMCMFNLFNEKEYKTEEEKLWHGNDMFKVRGYYDISKEHKLNTQIKNKLSERIRLKQTDEKNPMIYAIKIFLNGLYGCARSAIFEKIHTPNCGWDCCWLGQQVQEYVIKRMADFGFESIYGDSVEKDTPITVQYNNQVQIIPIEDIFNKNLLKRTILIWTDKGWSNIKQVYRHKVNKTMYRILTRKGYVEVSEDHSLVVNNKSIKPSELKKKSIIELISYKLPQINKIDEDLCWLLGFFLAEGTTGYYDCPSGIKYSWAINQKDCAPLIKSQQILLKYGLNTKILNTLKSSNCNKLVPSNGNIKVFYELFKEWCLSKNNIKKVPSFILSASLESKKAFIEGYMLGDGSVEKTTHIKTFCSIDKPLFSGLCQIFNDLGFEYSLKIRPDKINVLTARIIRNDTDKRIRGANEIIKIEKYKTNDYIYDIETSNHHFCGGIGNINLHNTDSVMLLNKNKRVNKAYVQDCLKTIIKEINENVPFPVSTFDINIESYLDYIVFPFSKEPIEDAEGKHVKEGNKLVTEIKGKKKNYMYIHTVDDKKEIELVGLPIIKDNATELGLKLFDEVLKPLIIQKVSGKFTYDFIKETINSYLKKGDILTVIAREYKVKPFITYKKESQIQAQISKAYFNGQDGVIKLIKNKKIGKAGKGTKYCSIEEATANHLLADDLDLTKLWNELTPFIDRTTIPQKTKKLKTVTVKNKTHSTTEKILKDVKEIITDQNIEQAHKIIDNVTKGINSFYEEE